MKTVRVITLGCSKNRVDTEHLLAQLPAEEYSVVDSGYADFLLLNTCGFIGDAKEESIQAILEAAALKERGGCGKLFVFGCLSQRYSSNLPSEIPEVDAWFGARELDPVVRALGAVPVRAGRYLTEPGKGYAYLKISEGCDRRCSYCAIPFIRGPHRSVPMEDLIAEASQLASEGVRELIVIAQDSTFYGLDLYGRRALAELLDKLSAVPGIEWVRLHYSYPDQFPEDVLDLMAVNRKICRYIDIPVQHVSDKVLSMMHRHTTGDQTRALIAKMRSKVPGVALRTTMIVGHPGEGPAEFDELLDFVRETRFDRLGAFTYSEEEGTFGALNYDDDVPQEEKQRRYDVLMTLQSEVSMECNRARVGTIEKLMVDDCMDGVLICRSEFESPEVDGEVQVPCPPGVDGNALVGSFIQAKIVSSDSYDLQGELC